MIVEIPLLAEHAGYPSKVGLFEIPDQCPVCQGPRGPVERGISYDGSRRLSCDTWTNPCGHVDKYSEIRATGVRVSYADHPEKT